MSVVVQIVKYFFVKMIFLSTEHCFCVCSCLCRRAFDEAVKQLSRVSDPNIAQMLGIIRQREPLAIVMEYLSHGDLHQFLEQRVFDDTSDRMHRNGPPSLR